MTREPWQLVDGLLLLDKPLGLSSNHALQQVRRLFRARKAGHAGTLDPLATGLLLVCFGKGTRVAGFLLDSDKTYRAHVRLGIRTSTADAEGEVLEQRPVPDLDEAALERVLDLFRGSCEQRPPMYSALKRNGVPLYRLARRGLEVEREPRRVQVHELQLRAFSSEELEIDLRCSKGFYVRSLADDIGQALGCGAHLSALRRLSIGAFGRDRSMMTFEQLVQCPQEQLKDHLLPVDEALVQYPALELGPDEVKAFCQGQRLIRSGWEDGQLLRCYDSDRGFVGLAKSTAEGQIRPALVMG